MRRLLVVRPEPGASATAAKARERGLNAILAPLFEIEPIEWTVPEASCFDGLLLTSANAARFGGEQLRELRSLAVYAVGAATAEAARDEGFDIRSTGEAGIDRLLGSIEPNLKLLHLSGEDRKTSADVRQKITSVTVYRSRAKASVDLGNASGSVVLIHSPRAARHFGELIDRQGPGRGSITLAAISVDAAEAAGEGWEAVEVADSPSDDGLLALAERLCNNIPAT